MRTRALAVSGGWEFTPQLHGDPRGLFLEWFRADVLAEAVGHHLNLAQANLSVSARGVLRGVHFSAVPPGQAKFVTCVAGAVLDVVVDVRAGSPTFGQWDAVRLDTESRRAVYLGEGLGHAFMALADGSTVSYLCSTGYAPGREFGVHPLDPDLALPWPDDVEPVLSAKDGAAPGLHQALADGVLPDYGACQQWQDELARAAG